MSEELLKNIRQMLNQIGDISVCKGCHYPIWWVRHRSGKLTPYTDKALNHFIDCPEADSFRKKQ